MHAKKLEAPDLIKAIEYLGNMRSSSDDIHTYSVSPIHVLVYNEIMRFSKKELESIKGRYNQSESLYFAVQAVQNPFLYSALLSKEVFIDKLSKESKWLLKQSKSPSLDLYGTIYTIESSRKEDAYDFFYHMKMYLAKMDTPEKLEVAEKFYNKYSKSSQPELIEIAYDGINTPLSDFLLKKLTADNIDINQTSLMNTLLPKQSSDPVGSKFFISSLHFEKMKSCFNKGFRFNEKNYTFSGDTILTALLKSERDEMANIIMPYLGEVKPKTMTMAEQNELVEKYSKSRFYKEIKVSYLKLIYSNFDKLLKEKPTADTPSIKI